MPRQKFEVTKDDLEGAVRGDSSRCAVARAIARQHKNAREIEVDTQTIRYTDHDGRWWWATPIIVAQYVSDFDLGLPIGDEAVPGEQLGEFQFTLRDAVRRPQRRLTDAGKANKKAYNAHLAAIRALHGLSYSGWWKLDKEQRRAYVEEARQSGINTFEVGERTGVERTLGASEIVAPRPLQRKTEPGREPPKIMRTHRRTYGNRNLRWNRPPEDAASGAVI